MTSLNLSKLAEMQKDKFKIKINIYNNILKKIHQRIINVASNSLDCFCFYVMQDFIFGIPNYNKNECIQYIFKKLIQNGFKVLYTHPNLFYISWNHIKKDNNINRKITTSNNENIKKIKDIKSYKPSGNFIYDDQLTSLKYKSKNLLNN